MKLLEEGSVSRIQELGSPIRSWDSKEKDCDQDGKNHQEQIVGQLSGELNQEMHQKVISHSDFFAASKITLGNCFQACGSLSKEEQSPFTLWENK